MIDPYVISNLFYGINYRCKFFNGNVSYLTYDIHPTKDYGVFYDQEGNFYTEDDIFKILPDEE